MVELAQLLVVVVEFLEPSSHNSSKLDHRYSVSVALPPSHSSSHSSNHSSVEVVGFRCREGG